nr:hypothetical protein CFP56_13178 [Quercus suber]
MSNSNITKQRRMLTQANSPLGRVNLVGFLDNEKAWMTLPKALRQELYSQLPTIGNESHDIDINPLHSALRPYMEDAIANWQEDLREGRESKKWRQEAIDAGRERERGKFDEYSEAHKEEWWGDGEVDQNHELRANTVNTEHGSPRDNSVHNVDPSSGNESRINNTT